MSQTFRAACVQMRTGLDVAANIAAAEKLIREAKLAGAAFVATPAAVRSYPEPLSAAGHLAS